MTTSADGPLGYTEIPADDLGRAKAFYSEVFGWTFQDAEGMDYAFFDSGEDGVGGGLMRRGDQGPAQPVNYVICDDLDAALQRIAAGGGAVVTPRTAFGDAGWLAHAVDTEGNLFGVWQARDDG